MIRSFATAGLLCLVPIVARAQVGHEPRRSPYRDLEHRQELTFFGGQFGAAKEPANVAPKSGPMFGVAYEFRMSGPAYFTARIAGVLSERNVTDPTKLLAERMLGTQRVNMMLVDAGFALNLTGYKSWHGLVPALGVGAGIGSGFDKSDVGGFKFGTPFVLSVRPALKFAPRGRWQGRIDGSNYLYRIRYPESYFTKSTADPTVLVPGSSRNLWRRNLGVTVGVTYTYGR